MKIKVCYDKLHGYFFLSIDGVDHSDGIRTLDPQVPTIDLTTARIL